MKKLIGIFAVCTLALSFMLVNTARSEDVIKIGHMRPLTGPMAQMSQEMVRAFDWAFEQVGYQVAGKKIEIIVQDSEASAEKAIDVARKMVEKDKVALIVNGELKHRGTPTEVIRAEYISAAYRTPVEVVPHPVTGAPIIFPQGALDQ